MLMYLHHGAYASMNRAFIHGAGPPADPARLAGWPGGGVWPALPAEPTSLAVIVSDWCGAPSAAAAEQVAGCRLQAAGKRAHRSLGSH